MSRSVFVVEDEEPVRASLTRLLRVLGFASEGFASAEAFLADYAANEGGCLLVDLRLPGMSGLDLIEELERRGAALPVIVMSGHTDAESLQRLQTMRTLGFLEKPFSVGDLKAMLERWTPSA